MKHILLFITLSLLPVSMLHAQEYVSWTISVGKGTLAVKDDATVNTSFSEPAEVHQAVDLAPQQPILLAARFSYTF